MRKSFIAQWWLSLIFLVGYVCVFGTWTLWTHRDFIIASTVMAVVLGVVAIWMGLRSRYFINRAETFAYGCILADVIAEATLLIRLIEGEAIPPKPAFWLCALAFAVVLGGYRWLRLSKPMPSAG